MRRDLLDEILEKCERIGICEKREPASKPTGPEPTLTHLTPGKEIVEFLKNVQEHSNYCLKSHMGSLGWASAKFDKMNKEMQTQDFTTVEKRQSDKGRPKHILHLTEKARQFLELNKGSNEK